ncbi:glycosyltransferase [Bizionia argentinensis JUB59]|uniref:Glycosyltransferase n=1 Tax=Bizionia argentinensis JUB59 TaxID=1046627 RepID=G2EC05_9FLAO|nr:glycosyltransferase family 4 protein [Bizionia argentinensis]EGV43960.1 glycosyltransferase [Bizionia argentinensis JUB59]
MLKKLLIIGSVWPEPKSSAAGTRMLQLMTLFLSENYKITFATATSKTEDAFDLATLGIPEVAITLNDASFDDFIKAENPDIVLFDRFLTEEQFGWRVAEHCPNALRLLDTEDLHGLRKARELAFKAQDADFKKYLVNATSKREIASIYRCDLSLIISEAEMDLLHHYFKVDVTLLHYLPFLLEPISEKTIKESPDFNSRGNFITIGNFFHKPNYQSVLYLKEVIWPGISKQLPKAELHIYGAYASQKVTQLHNPKAGFLVKGFADNVHEVMQQSRVCLAPLQFGAGLKGKLIDAMLNGTPCAMSKIAAEGMFGDLEPNGFIFDDPDSFIEKAVELYTDESTWKTKQENGFQTINKRFDKELYERSFIEIVDKIKSDLHTHRENNFTGQMLQHHSLQSTKFMSKWIELKNK